MESHGKKDMNPLLKKLEQYWDVPERTSGDVPDGKYQVKIEKAMINESKSSGRLQTSWTFRIMEGPMVNRRCFKHAGMDSEDNLSYFRGDIAKLGHTWPSSPYELPSILEELVGGYAEITVKTTTNKDSGQEFTNIYFNRAIDPISSVEDDLPEEELPPEPPKKKAGLKKPGRPPVEPEEPEEPEDEEPEELAVVFDEEDLTDSMKAKLIEIAEKMKLDADTYESYMKLIEDMCVAKEITGVFDTPKALIKALV